MIELSAAERELNTFRITKSEEEMFDMLRNVVIENNLRTTVRVAGGWVRDKILGKQGKPDIDIALDDMMGSAFATLLINWCQKHGMQNIHFNVVQLNPEKSKHLETATMNIGEFSVDFVNLRSETYSSTSRIPIMQFGTPLDDAMRRDLTINSLFYNVNTRSLEDFTQRGITDLNSRVVRTPLAAEVTLTDDPLRALRAIRFACRLNFSMCPELASAASSPVVHESLVHKVSRERISQEVDLMMSDPSHNSALLYFVKFNILPIVLYLPSDDTICSNNDFRIQGVNLCLTGELCMPILTRVVANVCADRKYYLSEGLKLEYTEDFTEKLFKYSHSLYYYYYYYYY
jgi:tRNA nucleotidyltransferase (CCA-adding enzyme)